MNLLKTAYDQDVRSNVGEPGHDIASSSDGVLLGDELLSRVVRDRSTVGVEGRARTRQFLSSRDDTFRA
jgi:hypothetical protein